MLLFYISAAVIASGIDFNDLFFFLIPSTCLLRSRLSLKVREHKVLGPYVDGLSQLAVTSFEVCLPLLSRHTMITGPLVTFNRGPPLLNTHAHAHTYAHTHTLTDTHTHRHTHTHTPPTHTHPTARTRT